MIPITYETIRVNPELTIVKASVQLKDRRVVEYGYSEEEAKQKIIDYLGITHDVSPESFVFLPPPTTVSVKRREYSVVTAVLIAAVLFAVAVLWQVVESLA